MIALDLIVLVPLLFAVVVPFVSGPGGARARWAGLLGSAAQLFAIASLAPAGVFAGARITGAQGWWSDGLWGLATDGLSTPLLVLTAVVGLTAAAASWRIEQRPAAHFALLLLLQAAVAAVFLADNLVLFYIAWECVLIPMYLLIAGWGASDAKRAALKFLVYTFAGGVVLLAGILYVAVSTGSVRFAEIIKASSSIGSPTLAFVLLGVGFLVKLPSIPFHTWLPDAHTEAPTAGSMVLAGVLLKMGGYGLVRIALPMAPDGFAALQGVLAAVGIAGIVWGAAAALVQTDLKRLVAYSSVAHMGFVVLAVSVATPESLGAAVLTMVSHGLVAAALFFMVGALHERTHTRELSLLGGLGSTLPRWSALFILFCLASAGLPGLSGFPGELVTLLEGFSAWGWWIVVACIGVVLAAAYNLRAISQSVAGEPHSDETAMRDLDPVEAGALVSLAVLVVVLGVAPWLVTSSCAGVVTTIATLVGRVI